ncbi:MAG: hypothetical protein AAF990_25610 [Bacteroidota bacterium]
MKNAFSFLLMLLCCTACGDSSGSQENKPEDLALKICDCAKASIDLNNQMADLLRQNEKDAFIQMSSKASQTFKESVRCVEQKMESQEAGVDKMQLKIKLKQNCLGMPDRLIEDILLKITG